MANDVTNAILSYDDENYDSKNPSLKLMQPLHPLTRLQQASVNTEELPNVTSPSLDMNTVHRVFKDGTVDKIASHYVERTENLENLISEMQKCESKRNTIIKDMESRTRVLSELEDRLFFLKTSYDLTWQRILMELSIFDEQIAVSHMAKKMEENGIRDGKKNKKKLDSVVLRMIETVKRQEDPVDENNRPSIDSIKDLAALLEDYSSIYEEIYKISKEEGLTQ